MAQRLVSEEGEDSGDNEGEEEGDDEGDEDEGEDLIYQPEDFQNELFPSEDQPYDNNIQDDSNQPILIPQGGLDFDEDSNGEIAEEEDDDSQIPSDWSQNMDEDEMVDNGFYVPEEDENESEEMSEEDQERAWMELQQVSLLLKTWFPPGPKAFSHQG